MRTEKICGECRQLKPVSEFFKHKRDGYQWKCKACHRREVKIYQQTPTAKKRNAKSQERSRQNPELKVRYRARAIAFRMTANGNLKQQPCAFCQEEQTQRHHPDYTQPLLIVWLCGKCHKELHTRQKKI